MMHVNVYPTQTSSRNPDFNGRVLEASGSKGAWAENLVRSDLIGLERLAISPQSPRPKLRQVLGPLLSRPSRIDCDEYEGGNIRYTYSRIISASWLVSVLKEQ